MQYLFRARFVLFTASGLLTTAALAQHPSGGPGGRGGPDPARLMQRMPVYQVLDADGDGAISAAEIEGASAALATLDKDESGSLSIEELRPEPPPGGGRGQQPMRQPRAGGQGGPGQGQGQGDRPPGARMFRFLPVLGALDTDDDFLISSEEIGAASFALAGLDTDGDGMLAGDEIAPVLPAGRGRGRGPGQPNG